MVYFVFNLSFGIVIVNSPLCSSTAKVEIPFKTGPCSGYPVFTEKAALCQGHNTLSAKRTPVWRAEVID